MFQPANSIIKCKFRVSFVFVLSFVVIMVRFVLIVFSCYQCCNFHFKNEFIQKSSVA